MYKAPDFILSLTKTNSKAQGRKVWSIDLETVWLPYFTANNALGLSNVPHEAIGAPLRLATNPDGSVKFSKSGRPVIKVAKDISDNVRLTRENFIAGLQNHTNEVFNAYPDKYKEQVQLSIEAGKPIKAADNAKLEAAMAKMVAQALAHAEDEAHKVETPEAEMVTA